MKKRVAAYRLCLRPVRLALRNAGRGDTPSIVKAVTEVHKKHPKLVPTAWRLVGDRLCEAFTQNPMGTALPRFHTDGPSDPLVGCLILGRARNHPQAGQWMTHARGPHGDEPVASDVIRDAKMYGTRLATIRQTAEAVINECQSQHGSVDPTGAAALLAKEVGDFVSLPVHGARYSDAQWQPWARSLLYPKLLHAAAIAVASPRLSALKVVAIEDQLQRVREEMTPLPRCSFNKTWAFVQSELTAHTAHAVSHVLSMRPPRNGSNVRSSSATGQRHAVDNAVRPILATEGRVLEFLRNVDPVAAKKAQVALPYDFLEAVNHGVHHAMTSR